MNEKDIDDFVNGRACLMLKIDGGFTMMPISEDEYRCFCCNRTEEEIGMRFKVGDKIIYDSINGTDGRCVGEGIVVEAKNCFQYLIDVGDYLRWYRNCELEPFIEF